MLATFTLWAIRSIQVLVEMPSIGRVYILTRWFLEVKSHSCSSDLNELSLGLRMDVIRVARDPFPSRQPCQPMGSFQTSCWAPSMLCKFVHASNW